MKHKSKALDRVSSGSVGDGKIGWVGHFRNSEGLPERVTSDLRHDDKKVPYLEI